MNWLLHVLGIDNVSGRWYGFWSGFGSDIGQITLLGGMITMVRQQNCEVKGCPRLGRHKTAAGHRVCKVHSPTGVPSHSDVIDAHNEAKRNGQ